MPNVTNLPAPRVPLIDQRTGLVSREWFRFFQNLFNLTGGGSNDSTLQDVQISMDGGYALQAQADAFATELQGVVHSALEVVNPRRQRTPRPEPLLRLVVVCKS